ncbi:MAG: hypothetical protein WBM13_06145 [Bacteroidia bacterium]
MKQITICLFFIITCYFGAHSQTRTIKIAKPTVEALDSITTVKLKYFVTAFAGLNYTLKNNNKVGYQLGVLFPISLYKSYRRRYFIGVKYSQENQYYKSIDLTVDNVQNNYLSMPIGVVKNLLLGAKMDLGLVLGLTPEYQVKLKSDKLKDSQFNPFNVSTNISVVFPIRNRFGIQVEYSKDIFGNLKSKNIYNLNGDKIGNQQSHTNLMTVAVIFTISR